MKNSNELTQKIDLVALKGQRKYSLIEGGKYVLINNNGKYKKLGVHNLGPNGVLCDDLETFVEWEQF